MAPVEERERFALMPAEVAALLGQQFAAGRSSLCFPPAIDASSTGPVTAISSLGFEASPSQGEPRLGSRS